MHQRRSIGFDPRARNAAATGKSRLIRLGRPANDNGPRAAIWIRSGLVFGAAALIALYLAGAFG